MTLRDIDLTALIDRCEALDGASIKTGVQEGDPNLEKAIWTNFGTDDNHIPERPVISEFGETHRSQLQDASEKAVRAVIARKQTAEAALEKMADKTEKMMRDALMACDDPPNAPATVAQKGFDDPWIETGSTVFAIQAKVEV